MDKDRLYRIIVEKLRSENLRFNENASNYTINGTCSFEGEIERRVEFTGRMTDHYLIISAENGIAAKANIPKMAYLVAELNNSCLEGKFVLDLNSGAVRFVNAIDLDLVETVCPNWLYRAVILPAVMMLNFHNRLCEYVD